MIAAFTQLGWTCLVAVMATTTVALVLCAWRTFKPTATVHAQYRVAAGALVACLVVVILAPVSLLIRPHRLVPALPRHATSETGTASPVESVPTPAPRPDAPSQTANTVAGLVGVLWLGGAAVMLARLAGGWFLVRRLARRARPTESMATLDATARLQAAMSIRTPVRVCESQEVEVPIIVGFRPALIMPPNLVATLSSDALEPLLAHELAHVRRRDYTLNLLQSIADAVLVAFPGARWISTRIRETREYCCDDIALRLCGDTRRYVEALAGIAALSVVRQPVAALGVGGPRLAARMRRLLHGETDVRHRGPRLLALALAAGMIVLGSSRVVALAVSHVDQLRAGKNQPAVAGSGRGFAMFVGYLPEQAGSAVTLPSAVVSTTFACDYVRARNNANVAVTGLAFVAVVTLDDGTGLVQIHTTDLLPVSIAPGGEADVDVHLLPQAEWGQLGPGASRIQVMCGLTEVTYANGARWQVIPNPAARTSEAALSLPPSEVSRQLFAAPPSKGWECHDDRGAGYSIGGLAPIRNEPGTLAQCVDASLPGSPEHVVRWVEYRAGLQK